MEDYLAISQVHVCTMYLHEYGGSKECTVKHSKSCPVCAIAAVGGQQCIAYSCYGVFQIVGVDVMDLPKTECGNKHVVVFQDWYSRSQTRMQGSKAERIAKPLEDKLVPFFEVLLSDKGTICCPT